MPSDRLFTPQERFRLEQTTPHETSQIPPGYQAEYRENGKIQRLFKTPEQYTQQLQTDRDGQEKRKTGTYIPHEILFDEDGFVVQEVKREPYKAVSQDHKRFNNEEWEIVEKEKAIFEKGSPLVKTISSDYPFLQRDSATQHKETRRTYVSDVYDFKKGEHISYPNPEQRTKDTRTEVVRTLPSSDAVTTTPEKTPQDLYYGIGTNQPVDIFQRVPENDPDRYAWNPQSGAYIDRFTTRSVTPDVARSPFNGGVFNRPTDNNTSVPVSIPTEEVSYGRKFGQEVANIAKETAQSIKKFQQYGSVHLNIASLAQQEAAKQWSEKYGFITAKDQFNPEYRKLVDQLKQEFTPIVLDAEARKVSGLDAINNYLLKKQGQEHLIQEIADNRSRQLQEDFRSGEFQRQATAGAANVGILLGGGALARAAPRVTQAALSAYTGYSGKKAYDSGFAPRETAELTYAAVPTVLAFGNKLPRYTRSVTDTITKGGIKRTLPYSYSSVQKSYAGLGKGLAQEPLYPEKTYIIRTDTDFAKLTHRSGGKSAELLQKFDVPQKRSRPYTYQRKTSSKQYNPIVREDVRVSPRRTQYQEQILLKRPETTRSSQQLLKRMRKAQKQQQLRKTKQQSRSTQSRQTKRKSTPKTLLAPHVSAKHLTSTNVDTSLLPDVSTNVEVKKRNTQQHDSRVRSNVIPRTELISEQQAGIPLRLNLNTIQQKPLKQSQHEEDLRWINAFIPQFYDSKGRFVQGNPYSSFNEAVQAGMRETDESAFQKFTVEKKIVPLQHVQQSRQFRYPFKFQRTGRSYQEKRYYRFDRPREKRGSFDMFAILNT